jgi:hypothetical protein
MHCGEPMTLGFPQTRTPAPQCTEAGGPDWLEVYLQTWVLHCRCGFQMEIPRVHKI